MLKPAANNAASPEILAAGLSMPLRYAVLHHTDVPDPHFDLMFETAPGSTLLTWRSAEWPIRSRAIVTRIPDHRRDYLDYDGPVSDDRGQVARVISGTFRWQVLSDDLVVLVTEQEHRFTFRRQGDTSLWQIDVGQTR